MIEKKCPNQMDAIYAMDMKFSLNTITIDDWKKQTNISGKATTKYNYIYKM